MKYIVNVSPRYEFLRQVIESLPQTFDTDHRMKTIYDGRNKIKTLTLPDGMTINIKRFAIPKGINRLVYSWGIRPPKGERAFDYPAILRQAHIDTPREIAYIEQRDTLGLLGYSYFISEQCTYPHRLYEIGNAPQGSYEELAIALGRFAAQMHQSRLLHLDFSPGNILWERDSKTGDYRFSLVDINRMHMGYISLRRGCRSLCRLWGPKRFISILIREYARVRGFDPDQCEQTVMGARAKFWKRYARKRMIEFDLEL